MLIKPVTPKDYDFIYITRIHPDNLNGFFTNKQFPYEEHIRFMNDHAHQYYVGQVLPIPGPFVFSILNWWKFERVGFVGVVDDDWRVAVHPDHKGQGYATEMIQTIMPRYPNTYARILKGNEASLRTFTKCGFIFDHEDDTKIVLKAP
jgi:RimJ/RimL family protein N-acetyltransferase